MKCPNCSHDQKRSMGMVCASCGYQFVFDPKGGDGLADGKFLAIVRKASGDGTYKYTRNQLYGAFCQARGGKTPTAVGCLVGLGLTIAGFLFHPAAGIGGIIAGGILAALTARYKVPSQEQFQTVLNKWIAAGRPLDGLITKPELGDPPPEWDEADVYDYGVERVLVVERDILVDLLVKNNFHAEARTLIVSERGYPPYLMPRVREVLRERPELPVFLLHDASERGEQLRDRVQGLLGAALEGHPVIDLGLDRNQVRRGRIFGRLLDNPKSAAVIPVDLLAMTLLAAVVAASFERGAALLLQDPSGVASTGAWDFGAFDDDDFG